MQPIQSFPSKAMLQGNLPTPNVGQPGAATDSQPFKNLLLDSLNHVNAMQVDADKAVQELFTGGEASAAEVLTAVQKADMTFRMMMQIRNKLVQAYQEVKDIRI